MKSPPEQRLPQRVASGTPETTTPDRGGVGRICTHSPGPAIVPRIGGMGNPAVDQHARDLLDDHGLVSDFSETASLDSQRGPSPTSWSSPRGPSPTTRRTAQGPIGIFRVVSEFYETSRN
jgi:hypothetical protein